MEPDDSDIDGVAFQTLWADPDVGLVTAYAASVNDSQQQPARINGRASFDLGLLIGLLIFVVWMLW